MSKLQKIDQKKELASQAGMAEIDAGSIFGELEKELPKEEATQEQKDSNPYQFKFEVKVTKLTKRLKGIKHLEVGKLGRVIEVLDDKTVLVDFWNTIPAKVPMKTRYLELSRTREQVERDSGAAVDESIDTGVNGVIETVNGVTQGQSYPIKFNQGKPRMDLIRPEFTLALGEVLGYGAEKYSEKLGEVPNYLKGEGFNYSTILGSLERHIAQFKMGVDLDEETGKSHLAHAAANLMFLLTYQLTGHGVDDRVVLGSNKRKASENEKATKSTE